MGSYFKYTGTQKIQKYGHWVVIKIFLRELVELFHKNRTPKISKFGHWGVIKNIIDGEVFVRLGTQIPIGQPSTMDCVLCLGREG